MCTQTWRKLGALLAVLAVNSFAAAERPEDEWYQVRERVLEQLGRRDVLAWSDDLAKGLDKADRRTVFEALYVFPRASHRQRVPAAVRRLGALRLPGRVLRPITDYLIQGELWDGARQLVQARPDFRPGEFKKLRIHWWGTADRGKLEALLAGRCEADWNVWHQDYYWVLARAGKIPPLLEKLKKAFAKDPTNYQPVREYLAAVAAMPAPDWPKIGWLGDLARPKFATDAYDLGRALANHRHYAKAITLFDHSLATPIVKYDIDSMRWRCSAFIPEPEKTIRRWTKIALARSCKHAGRLDRAQSLVQDLVGPDATLADLSTLRLAGWVQAASGQRAVEKKILKSQEQQKGSVKYWLGRAWYYLGRKEPAPAEEAFQEALALPPDQQRTYAVTQYANYLNNRSRTAEAIELVRAELKRVGPNHESAPQLVSRLLYFDGRDGASLRLNDPLLWEFLSQRKGRREYLHPEESLLKELLKKSKRQGRAHFFWTKAMPLAGPKAHPRRRMFLGRLLLTDDQTAKALPLLEDAFRRADSDTLRSEAAHCLMQAHLKLGKWKSAEKVIQATHELFDIDSRQSWLGKIAIAAARSGAKDDAVRLWKWRANVDLTNLRQIDEMAQAGMTDELRGLYSDLVKRDPGNQAVGAALKTLEAR